MEVVGLDTELDRDPFVDPDFTRDAVVEETDVVIVGAGWAGMTELGRKSLNLIICATNRLPL